MLRTIKDECIWVWRKLKTATIYRKAIRPQTVRILSHTTGRTIINIFFFFWNNETDISVPLPYKIDLY